MSHCRLVSGGRGRSSRWGREPGNGEDVARPGRGRQTGQPRGRGGSQPSGAVRNRGVSLLSRDPRSERHRHGQAEEDEERPPSRRGKGQCASQTGCGPPHSRAWLVRSPRHSSGARDASAEDAPVRPGLCLPGPWLTRVPAASASGRSWRQTGGGGGESQHAPPHLPPPAAASGGGFVLSGAQTPDVEALRP